MNVKQIRKILEKLDDALDAVEIDMNAANDERDDYAFQLEEAREELSMMGEELKLLCKLLFDAKIRLPHDGHFIDIDPYVPKTDPQRGMYEIGYR